MSLRETVQAELPFLRRYARALTGSANRGDETVRALLEAIIAAPASFRADATSPRAELFRIYHRATPPAQLCPLGDPAGPAEIAGLPLEARQVLLLTAVEGFDLDQTAAILGIDSDQVTVWRRRAQDALTPALEAKVMVIEDEAIIALHLQEIVESLGCEVVGIARTRDEAVELAHRTQPELVLADVSLADRSSGIDAVNDILAGQDVPVIFITAFPERLLTGDRPEPAYLLSKPFEPASVAATIWQALLVHRAHRQELVMPAVPLH